MPKKGDVRGDVKAKLQGRFEELKTLRDTIRVDLHLASMELRNEWRDLENKLPLPDPGAATEQLKDVTGEALDKLTNQLRIFRDRLRAADHDQRVAELMTSTVVTCGPGDTVAHAVGLMWNRDVGWLPVVDQAGTVVGTITDRDAAVAACTRGKRLDELRVADVMSTEVTACAPEARAEEALDLLRARRLRRLPVTGSAGKLVGVVTLNDFARARAQRLAAPTAHEGADVVAALATIAGAQRSAASSN
jgi:CBS-domain-containing membrane protein